MGATRIWHLCGCGGALAGARELGWQPLYGGSVARLVVCRHCQSTRSAQEIVDASLCSGCFEVVTGRAGDPKLVVERGPGEDSAVYCAECAGGAEVADPMITDWRRGAARARAGLPLRGP